MRRFYHLIYPKVSHLQTLLPSNFCIFFTDFWILTRFQFVLDRYTRPTQVRSKIDLFNVTHAFNLTPIELSMLPHNMKNQDFGRMGYDAFLCVFFLYRLYFWVILSIDLRYKLPHVFYNFLLSIDEVFF